MKLIQLIKILFKNVYFVISLIADILAILSSFGIDLSSLDEGTVLVIRILMMVLVSVFSCIVGWQLHKSYFDWHMEMEKAAEEREFQRREAKRRQEEEAHSKGIMNSRRDNFERDEDARRKAVAVLIFESPNHEIRIKTSYHQAFQDLNDLDNNYMDYFRFDNRGHDAVYVRLEKWLIELFEAYPDLLDGISPRTMRRCRKALEEAEKR